jgi:hypothetical protein
MKKLALLLAVLLVGCASDSSLTRRMANVREGMTTQELFAVVGKPQRTTNQGALRTYEYVFNDTKPPTSYYVIVGEDGRVRSYGQN